MIDDKTLDKMLLEAEEQLRLTVADSFYNYGAEMTRKIMDMIIEDQTDRATVEKILQDLEK